MIHQTPALRLRAPSRRNQLRIAAALAPLALAAAATSASAEAAPSPTTIQEVVVTARLQAESLQKVPVTVTAVSGADLKKFQFNKPEDVANRVPTLNVTCCGSGSGAAISLRGVGSSYISAAFDSAVALNFDGVVVSSMRVLQSGFFDMRQVEVLKGPQSLYFGKGASAGVLSFTSADPTPTFQAEYRGAYEFEQHGYTVEAYAAGPINDSLGFRIAGRYNTIDHVLHNIAPGVVHPWRGETNTNFRLTLDYHPTGNFKANLKVNYVGRDSDGAIRNTVIYCGKNGVADPISLSGGALLIPAGYPCDISGKVYYLPDAAPPLALKAPPPTDNNGGAGYATSAIYFGRLRMDYNITDKISLSSVTGYLKQDAVEYDSFSYSGVGGPNTVIRGVNYNGVGLGVGGGLAYNNLRQFSEELRFVTSFDGPLNFMLAGFIEDRKIYFNTAQNAVNIALTFGPDPVTGATFDWYKTHYTRAKAYSVFGSGTYSITEQLKLTGGVRWTKEKKTQIIALPYEHAILTAIGFAPSGFVAAPIDFRDDNLSPEVSLTYTPTNDVTLYGAYKEGFKSGGIDNSALPSGSLKNLASPDPAVRAATAAGLKFASETVKGGEIGAKTQWLDRTLTLNASVYNYVFRNIQVQLLDAKAVQFRTTNAGELTSRGVDLDFQWRPSIEGLTIYGSAAYTDAKFTKSFVPDPIGQPGVDLRGRAAANAPKWAGNVAASYHAAVSDGYGLDLTGNVKYQSSYFIRNGNTQDYVQGASTLVDLAATIGPDTGPWSLSLIGTNITDKRIATSGGPRPFLTPTGDDQILNLNEGRKVYIQAALKF